MRVNRLSHVFGLVLATLGPAVAHTQEPDFVMKPIAEFTDDAAVPQIIGGIKSDPSDWPATFVFLDPAGGSCTSTAVGPRVVLTAAHCINDQARGVVDLGGTMTQATCHHHPDYRANVSSSDPDWEKKVSPDFALCLLARNLQTRQLENVNTDGGLLRPGNMVRLLGFGCTTSGGADDGFGVLYEGDAAVTAVASPPSYYTTTLGGAAVCYGDSGGGAYLYTNPAKTRRVLIGVNSRGDISTRSLLSTTNAPGFVDWATLWARNHSARICGLHSDAANCRPR